MEKHKIKKSEDWEIEFDKKIIYPTIIKGWGIHPEQLLLIKSFIRQLIKDAKLNGYLDAMQEIKKRGKNKGRIINQTKGRQNRRHKRMP